MLRLPLIKLDQIYWKPNSNWEMLTDEEFEVELWRRVKQHEKTGWVMDGNYRKHTQRLTEELVTDVICKSSLVLRWNSAIHMLSHRARLALSAVLFSTLCQNHA